MPKRGFHEASKDEPESESPKEEVVSESPILDRANSPGEMPSFTFYPTDPWSAAALIYWIQRAEISADADDGRIAEARQAAQLFRSYKPPKGTRGVNVG